MEMREQIEAVMNEHSYHNANGQRKIDGSISFTLQNGNYLSWNTVVSPALKKMQDNLISTFSEQEISTKYSPGGGSASLVPWVSLRPNGNGKNKARTTQGIYLTFLFSQDGEKCILAIMQGTQSYPGSCDKIKEHRKRIELIRTHSKKLESIPVSNSSLIGKFSTKLNQGFVDLKATQPKHIEWQHACIHWIEYNKGFVPDDGTLFKDVESMISMYKMLASDYFLIKTGFELESGILDRNNLSDSVEQINGEYTNSKNGWTISQTKARFMIESLSILPYSLDLSKMELEYDVDEWIQLCKLFEFLQITDNEILFVRQGTQSADGEELMRVVRCYRNVIIEGPPGVGKTHFFDELRKEFKENVTFLTFHPSTEYGDFIGGLRPAISQQTGKDFLEFKSTKGFFLEALEQTKKGKTLLWIDEINRGNVAKIFGELIGLIGTNSPQSPTIRNAGLDKDILDMSKNGGIVLDNLHIVGTINTADRSISHLDSAIRRRFKFVRLHPNLAIPAISSMSVIQQFEHINKVLEQNYGSDGMLGHSYLFELKQNPGHEEIIWKYSILPNIADIIMREGTESAEEVIGNINAHIPVDWKLKKRGKSYSAIVEIVSIHKEEE